MVSEKHTTSGALKRNSFFLYSLGMAKININKVSEAPEKEYLKSAKKLVLGSKRPPLFTRILLMVAFVFFCYYFFWNGLRVMALSSIDTIENPEEFKVRFQKLADDYGIEDGISSFKMYGLLMMAGWGVVGLGMALVYRRILSGYYLFFGGLLVALVVPVIILGFDYSFNGGVDIYDFIIPPALAGLFWISFKRLKKLKEEAKREALL